MPTESHLDPRLRVLYLLSVALGLFAFHRLDVVAPVAAAQAVLWLLVGLGGRRLVRQITKLWFFTLFIVVSYALTSEEAATDRWVSLRVLSFAVSLNVAGALAG